MKKYLFAIMAAGMMLSSCGSKAESTQAAEEETTDTTEVATVYYIKDITPENIIKIYEALGREAQGKVAVKISTGESNKSHQLDPNLIKAFVDTVHGTLVECSTAYAGNRNSPEKSVEAAREHGYTAIAEVDIMDANGDTILPVTNGRHLKHDIVGKDFTNYDFLVVLSHFKGHAMGGFGGALKNVAIGIASADGKSYIHSAGKVATPDSLWQNIAEQDAFLESMGEACEAVFNHMGDKMLFINVANNLSVDCDCDADPAAPKMADLGIFASLDPVALDRACVDAVLNSDDPGKADLIERMESRHATHLLDYSEQLGLGTQKYKIVEL